MSTVLPTTISGSLPKPGWLAPPRQLWAPWLLEGEALVEAKRDAVRLAIRDQESAGIDIITDGEVTRQHFVTTFIDALDGVDSTRRSTVKIRQRYDAEVPRVVGPVARSAPVYVDDVRFLAGETDRPIKYQLPGPMTMADTLADEYYGDRSELAMAFAEILNDEATEMVEAGASMIQFDEPAFNVYLDEVASWGAAALDRAALGLDCTTAVHICYGYGIGANIDWKGTLGAEWRQYERTFPVLAESTIDQVSVEVANSHVPLELLELLGDKGVQVGAIDVATDEVETPDDVARTLERVMRHVPPERIIPSTNCGLVPLDRATARGKLQALGAGAALARGRLD